MVSFATSSSDYEVHRCLQIICARTCLKNVAVCRSTWNRDWIPNAWHEAEGSQRVILQLVRSVWTLRPSLSLSLPLFVALPLILSRDEPPRISCSWHRYSHNFDFWKPGSAEIKYLYDISFRWGGQLFSFRLCCLVIPTRKLLTSLYRPVQRRF